MEYIRISRTDFKTGEKRKIILPNGRELVVFYLGVDRFFVFDNKCPHLGCDLSKYGVIIKEELVCQCHFSHFSIYSGEPKKGASKKPIKVYKVQVTKDEVVISLI
ncbi:Rieske (2Fe-2S) protein [Saccharolobus solfataricus]|uniref:Rieske (2Fe-2S) protein n=2 Tax=Saccharolobus solfataricus TaxID=2287 RepID=A0A0E3JTU1_SACSO|nr:Rieske (2Fe-2S) protein [Saccharolobus solfataricus]AKA73623.1 Rieske (2Fe-2S) protein [Saccharolobus solfataricus]AKA76321.1 Rieske (2Fe-2S) protein [Saccharolobus solfataricus]AKA79013.1 Rieske (2Fe-2S) protein [Saccharolobus solfataricus]AZF68092.1 Rieske (2Fe-2S) protein [Saccharolobus solfataricus]AZF70712.1 Rieske (2Fe-2S) protein [Saccharolobus solfataricus]